MPKLLFPAYLKLTACLLLLPVLSACKKDNAFDCLKSTGSIVTERRELAPFNEIDLKDNIEVVLVQDTEYFVEVKAGENLQENVKTEVIGNKLYISNLNKCNWVRSFSNQIVVTVHTPEFFTLWHDGFTTFRTEGTFKTDTVFLHLTGAGDTDLNLTDNQFLWVDMYEVNNCYLSGNSAYMHAEVMGLGKLYAQDFIVEKAFAKVGYAGDGTIHVTENLRGLMNHIGNLYYYGNPETVNLEITGEGKALAQE